MKRDESYEMYEYARKRLKQRKMLFFHFVVFVLGSIAMFCFNGLVQDQTTVTIWWPYAIGIWALLVFLHAVNVLIVDRFMGKRWEDKQVRRLVELQEQRIKELRAKVEKDFPLVDTQRDLAQIQQPTPTSSPELDKK
ncbi:MULTISPECIES: 2TM domain-containing protein [Myroides]|uniref:2TM domain-containing protein n=1 Tax=Myroides profundi TaxID=480520 RepID=A0AAJ5BEB0_MYRPR|nr:MULTISPECIES: 2TM domain-containing protein [Myroides]AJH13847.1 hypothetical protein MPR_0647 [Myroides profundi]MCO7724280.1 2TM domain-containing protein [Myroides odoratimimus]MDM1397347.1 2TM domain-containing protein [Myroides odoratimimus]MDM1519921.1 2TM domain-containing protein [Myroides odoratimimus]MDM1528134.1 2TM domain-containing protein [Myroides odoratimimus]